MTDSRIEQILERYRPADVPAELAARLLVPPEMRPSRRWPLAAAALLIATIGLHGRFGSTPGVPERSASAMRQDIFELTNAFGADSVARRSAELIVVHEYQRGAQR